MFGVGSCAALGTTMDLSGEVPLMLGLVYRLKALQRRSSRPEGALAVPKIG